MARSHQNDVKFSIQLLSPPAQLGDNRPRGSICPNGEIKMIGADIDKEFSL
jgi:hypothetical protein